MKVKIPTPLCISCNRPAAPHAATCAYCGETIPVSPRRRAIHVALITLASAGTIALTLVNPEPLLQLPAHLPFTLPSALLLALGCGLTLLPPTFHGVAPADFSERRQQAATRYFAGVLLAALVAINALDLWPIVNQPLEILALASANLAALFCFPAAFGIPWHKIPAGILLAAACAWPFSTTGF